MTIETLSRAPGLRGTFATAAAAAAALALLLSGCSPAPDDSPSALQRQSFPRVYAQAIDWGACDESFGLDSGLREQLAAKGVSSETFRCAMVEAPFDWNDPTNHDTIQLAVTHLPASGEGAPIGTLLGNPGGPGLSGVELAYSLALTPAFAPVMERYDVLGFDPRGIHRSTPIECEVESGLLELQLALCAKDQPLALSMGTLQVARDMELLRHLMGDDALHYAGFSYGTVIGASYSTLFPERVGRLLLDSAWPSDWASLLADYRQSSAFARETALMLAGCGIEYAARACPIDGEEALLEARRRLDEAPLIASDGTPIDGTMLNDYLGSGLYGLASGRGQVLDTVARALAGEQEGIDDLAAEMRGDGVRIGLNGIFVRCHSFPSDPGIAEVIEHIERTGLPPSLGGPEITDDTLRPYLSLSCDGLPNSGGDYVRFSGSPSATILVIGITGDHATPYEGSQQLVRELGNARLLTLEASGHIASFSNRSACADAAASAYLLEGELPPEGTVCAAD